MSDLILEHIEPLKNDQLQKGLYLVLLYADKIPPHLGLIFNGKYYSLSVKGQEIGVDSASIIRLVDQKKIATIFIQLSGFNTNIVKEILSSSFQFFPQVDAKTTCLQPIKKVVEGLYQLDTAAILFIYHLIPALAEKKLVQGYFQKNITAIPFKIKKYTMSDIINHIQKRTHVNA